MPRLNLLVLPEMAFTGYFWKSKEHINQVVETTRGPTTKWCKEVAKWLSCHSDMFPVSNSLKGAESI